MYTYLVNNWAVPIQGRMGQWTLYIRFTIQIILNYVNLECHVTAYQPSNQFLLWQNGFIQNRSSNIINEVRGRLIVVQHTEWDHSYQRLFRRVQVAIGFKKVIIYKNTYFIFCIVLKDSMMPQGLMFKVVSTVNTCNVGESLTGVA